MILSLTKNGGHVDTSGQGAGRRRRRNHSEQFKAEAVAACLVPGVSIAAVAMARSINANLLRRWVVEAERSQGVPLKPAAPAEIPQTEKVQSPCPFPRQNPRTIRRSASKCAGVH